MKRRSVTEMPAPVPESTGMAPDGAIDLRVAGPGTGAGPAVAPPVESGTGVTVPADETAADVERSLGTAKEQPFDAHEWGVIGPLALVGFFTTYDIGLLSLASAKIAGGLGVEVATFGVGASIIKLASLASLGTMRLADRWGRRTVLLISVLGFTVATGLTALAWGLAAFVAFQLVCRLFLSTEESLAGVVLTEELRPDRRGAGIAVLGMLSVGGFGLVAALLPLVDRTPLGWRLFYVVSLLPLLVVVYLRRNLKETRAFGVAAGAEALQRSWWPRLDPDQRARLWPLALMYGALGLLTVVSFFYAADLAENHFHWEGLYSIIILASGPATLLGFLLGGRLSDRFGRKPVTAVSALLVSAGSAVLFTRQPALFPVGFFLLAGAEMALHSVRHAYVSELFPTEVRATVASFVGAVNVTGGALGLAVVGLLASVVEPSTTIVVLAGMTAVTAVLLRRLPETLGQDVTAVS